jgi:hypothetical protein
MEPERVTRFVRAVTIAAGNQGMRAAETVADSSAAREEAGKTTWSWTKLEELIGDNGRAVCARVRQWLDPQPARGTTPAKSPAQELVTDLVHDAEDDLRAKWDTEMETYEVALAEYEAARKARAGGRKGGDGKSEELPEKPTKPVLERMTVTTSPWSR